MQFARHVLAVNDDLPIRTQRPVHSGKVRAVYWLTPEDSARLIAEKGYDVAPDTPLAVMIISDRLSAFDCIWHGEEQLMGVPGKGAALNAIAAHWFSLFKQHGLANSHILDIPHPLVWIVQQAQPIKIEAICRQYITGSMWRAYQQGVREFCGLRLPENLEQDQKLENILLTPSTKGILTGLEGVPEADDVNISRAQIERHSQAFGFKSQADIAQYEKLLTQGFALIANELNQIDQILVDTKFEFGYVNNKQGEPELIYMDEVGTPDSSRMWDKTAYSQGKVVENSKEGFRQFLLNFVADADVLLNKDRMAEREQLAANTALPAKAFLYLSDTYLTMAQKITGREIEICQQPRQEIISILAEQYGLIAAN